MRLLFLIVLCCSLSLQAQQPHWENPAIFEINKEPARDVFTSFDHRAAALTMDPLQSSRRISLDGIWLFHISHNPDSRPMEFYQPGFDVSHWDEIRVPGNWETQGFDVPIYVNHPYEFADPRTPHTDLTDGPEPPRVPRDYNPVGSYRRDFFLPTSWGQEDLEIFIHFGSVKSAFYLWVNGEKVGYSQGSKLPSEFNITPYVKTGQENTLAVEVYRWSDASYLECQDFWRISGIERRVFVYAQPRLRIRDFEVVSVLDDTHTDGLMDIELEVANHYPTVQSFSWEAELLDPDGNRIFVETQNATTDGGSGTFSLPRQTIPQVNAWSAEYPNLYTLVLTLMDQQGNVLESTARKIGFRSVEILRGQLLVNGVPILLKGVNIHSHNPELGHYLTEEIMMKDIELLKEHNFNAVRLSHYPFPERWYELCDEYGLYVVDEANIESHGLYYGERSLAKDPDWMHAHVDRLVRMVERTRNHPSVIIWSMGNEAGNGINFYEGYHAIKAADATKRPVQYERVETDSRYAFGWEWNTDIIVPQYPNPAFLNWFGGHLSARPLIPSEYSHSMGNSTGNFAEYWDEIYRHPQLQGGFIWDWVDQGLYKTTPDGTRFFAYGGDFGENMPSDGNFLLNGIIFPDRRIQPAMHEVKKVQQPIQFKLLRANENHARILVENRFDFTPLSDSQIWASIRADGQEIIRWNLDTLQAPPHSSVLVDIPVHEIAAVTPNTEYFLHLEASPRSPVSSLGNDHIMAAEQFLLPMKEVVPVQVQSNGSVHLTSNQNNIEIFNDLFTLNFSQETGYITHYTYQDNALLQQGPIPDFWRAVTDNDFGSGMHNRQIHWKKATLEHELTALKYSLEENRVVVEASYGLAGTPGSFHMKYEIRANGSIRVNNQLISTQDDGLDIPRVGVNMLAEPRFNTFTWFGKGPFENYADRNTGAFIDLYQIPAEKLMVPYIRPQENGNKTQVRWAALTGEEGNGLMVVSHRESGLEMTAMPYLTEDFDARQAYDYGPVHLEQKNIAFVRPRDFIRWNVDYGQRGVAGVNSWGAMPLEQYRLQSGNTYSWEFTLIPLTNSNPDEMIRKHKAVYYEETPLK